MIKEQLLVKFKDIFSGNGKVYFAPGRVNLIGEHTDYNGGHVFPCALDIGTYLVAQKRNDRLLRFYSDNFPKLGIIEVSLDNIVKDIKDDWANYPKGMINVLKNAGYLIEEGLDLLFYGNIPNGAGLSSSASVELATGIMLIDLFNLNIDRVSLVKFAQQAENQFIGVNCGIMDQFAIGMGKKDHAILLDTQNLEYQYVPLNLDGYKIVITNTNKKRKLEESKYNERRSECDLALKILANYINITSLGELSNEEFNELSQYLANPIIRKRAKHAVSENQRTILAQLALTNGDLVKFGRLMNESHISLRDDYEVTGIELDTLVHLTWEEPGVIGSRMTGAGFGGCTVSIVDERYIDRFIENIERKYLEIIGYKPAFYVVNVGDGASKLL